MKTLKSSTMTLTATLMMMAALTTAQVAAAQAIYKTVDADGNVTYTDQPPTPDAQPLDLPPITVADPYENNEIGDIQLDAGETVVDLVPYPDFRLLSPTSEQHFWGTGGTFTAQASTNAPLEPGHLVQFVLDGQVAGSGRGYFMEFTGIDRGEHVIRAEVVDTQGNSLARTDNVVFFMRQQSVINRNRNNRSGN